MSRYIGTYLSLLSSPTIFARPRQIYATKYLLFWNPLDGFLCLLSEFHVKFKKYFQVYRVATHLIYWGLAIPIYPICESNIYVVSPKINNLMTPVVTERFNEKFPGENLVACLSMFSLPTSIGMMLSLAKGVKLLLTCLKILSEIKFWICDLSYNLPPCMFAVNQGKQ